MSWRRRLTFLLLQGPNLDCFTERIASHPERLQNIYFNTVILLRAVSRIGPFLSAYGVEREAESKTQALLSEVLSIAKVAGGFDESSLFRGNDAQVCLASLFIYYKYKYLTDLMSVDSERRIQRSVPERFSNHGLRRM